MSGSRARAAVPASSTPSFREVYEGQLSYVYNTLRRLGIRHSDLPDATQEVFATIAGLLDDYDPERPLRPWLFGITYRVGLRYLEVAYRRREAPGEMPDAPDSAPGPDVAVERGEQRALVRRALERVEPKRRAVLILSYLEGMNAPEIAETLQVPVNSVYSRLHRARQEFSDAARRLGWRVR